MRVLHLVATGSGWGGLEKVVSEIATEQRRQGLDVRVAGHAELVEQLPTGGGVVFDLARSRHHPVLLWELWKLLKEKRIDVLHGHANKGAALTRTLRRLGFRGKTVATIHNTKKRVTAFRGHDAVTAVSERAASALGPIKSTVIRNGLPLPQERTVCEGLPSQPRGILLGAYGRFVEAKGFDLLLQALSEVPSLSLWLLGEGKLEAALKQQARDLGVEDRVWFGGYRADACEVMREVDLFVMPSRHEGFPLTLIEMLHREVPVVTASVAGAEEIVSSEFRFEVDDLAGLVGLLERAESELADWMVRQASLFEKARYELTIERCARQYGELYKGL